MAPAFIKRASQVQTAPSRSANEVLTVEDEAILLEIGEDLDKLSPAATKAAYGPAQREFREWCLKRAVKDGKPALEDIKDDGQRALQDQQRTMVTGSRVGIFLKECVVGRAHKPKGKNGCKKKANNETAVEALVGKTVGSSVINQYLSALCRLHKAQQAACNGQIPSPRTHPAVIAIAKTEKLKTADVKKSYLNDRTENTFLDGYCTDVELAAILDEGLRRNNREGLRDRTMAALSHYGILRGESTRAIQMPDLQQLPLDEREGPTPCDILVILLYNGKTNQEGKTQAMGAMRNKRWDLCPLGALGFWLFYRFQLSGETFGKADDTFPRLDTPLEWFPLFLFPGTTQQVEMKKDTHYHAVKGVLKNSGIGGNSSQVTHIFRGSAARMADLQGASERDISRAGRWDMSSMVQFYLTALPRETMRVLAGFSKDRGSFWIARDVDPPKELEDMIFPEASLWLEKLTSGDEHQSKSMAARGFIRLLFRLKRIILQDSVFLQQTQPNHVILRHAVFSSPLYQQYAVRVLEVVRTATSPISLQLQQAMPHMVTEMTNLRGSLTVDVRKIGTELRDEIEGVKELIGCLEERVERGIEKQADKSTKIGAVLGTITNVLQLIAGGVFETRLCLPAIDSEHLTKGMSTADNDLDDDMGVRDGEASSSGNESLPASSSSKTGLDILGPLLQAAANASGTVTMPEDHHRARTQHPNAPKTQSNHASIPVPATFVLESNHLTVKELWNEWYTGVFGRPSITAMLEKKLLKSEGQRKLFARRKIIIDEIVKLAEEKTVHESQVVERLEAYRATHGMSITKLQDDIKEKRGKGESII